MVSAEEINRFITDLPSQRRSGGFQSYYAPSLMLEDQNEPNPSYAPSDGTNETAYSSIFSNDGFGYAYSDSTAPHRNGPRRQNPHLPIPAPVEFMALPCELSEYEHCDIAFDINDEIGWIAHIANDHLRNHFPRQCICWFCPTEYTASSNSYEDRRQCYSDRMHHVAEHFRNDRTRGQIRPDRHFASHIYKIGILRIDEYQLAMSYHEPPQSEHSYQPGWRLEQPERFDVVIESRSRRRDHRPRTHVQRYVG